MQLGIIGLAQSGKTTVFNALTRGRSEALRSSSSLAKPVIGTAKVPDPRVDVLTSMYNPERVTPAEIRYIDFPATSEGNTRVIGGPSLNVLQQSDALILVLRNFENPAVPHEDGSVDPARDLSAMQFELAFSDLAVLERRAKRVESELKGAKSDQRDKLQRETNLIRNLKEGLDVDIPIRKQELSLDDRRSIMNFQFLTDKPLLTLLNIDEEELSQTKSIEQKVASLSAGTDVQSTALCGKLELELSEMDPADESEFRTSLAAGDSGSSRIISLSYSLLNQASFFTTGPDEVKAWTIVNGLSAAQAAGQIHSDIERGFIRAEVISYNDLIDCGSIAQARQKGLLRTEGRTYPVQDGDIINFLFNV
ncbi:MAG: hypothetical protein BZY82_10330 [SAR202 cluster bacterium Io17-Chloro-G3]|nr:MAG: hypothetical protein BZY82_10330 [SAR202 cluster bacterium Io17-Chloro-G3]